MEGIANRGMNGVATPRIQNFHFLPAPVTVLTF